jgi:hypothetical protein
MLQAATTHLHQQQQARLCKYRSANPLGCGATGARRIASSGESISLREPFRAPAKESIFQFPEVIRRKEGAEGLPNGRELRMLLKYNSLET